MAIYSASLKVSRFIHQDHLDNYHVFHGGDHDLLLIPVNTTHALLLAGKELARSDRILKTVEAMFFVRGDVENVLQSLGVVSAPVIAEPAVPEPEALPRPEMPEPEPEVDLDALLATASKKSKVKDVDAFWDDAAEKAGNIPTNPDVITFDQARKLGLNPGKGETIPARNTGLLKKK
jgi:hypothetical protein